MGIFFNKKANKPEIKAVNELMLWPAQALGTEGKQFKENARSAMGLKVISNIHHPSLTAYFPDKNKATGTAIIIAPGGSHKELWIEHEGHNPARFFCDHGIAAFVLKYRLSEEPGSNYTLMEHALADMQQAIRYVRHHAKEWGINLAHIGIMGFSAGGELAALAAMYPDDGSKEIVDKIGKQSSYPNFQALIYPGGTENFRASKHAPPLFLLCGNNDYPAICQGLATTYLRYKEEGIPVELHIYANEQHGFGIRKGNSERIAKWPILFMDWLKAIGFM